MTDSIHNADASDAGVVDLHCHSTASDGFLSPQALIAKAASVRLQAIALTDHDTVSGIDAAAAAAASGGIEFVPGIELSSNSGSAEIHLLGYFVDPASQSLADHLIWCQEKRIDRIVQICGKLARAGVPLSVDEVMGFAGTGSVGRPHVAQAMMARGYVTSIGEAFHRYIGMGKPGYVQRENISPAAAIAVIRNAGGAAVLAHPYATPACLQLLPELIAAGLVGLEAWYGEYDTSSRQHLAGIASRHGLIATGGSDYHGDGFKEGRGLGSVDVPYASIAELRLAATRA